MDKKRKVIALLSGGLDSVVNLAIESKLGSEIKCLFINYNQRAHNQEREASKYFAQLFGAEFVEVSLEFMSKWSSSALNKSEQPLPSFSKLEDLDNLEQAQKSAQKVWVPNRNGLFINVAASIAEAYEYASILVGFNKEEASTFPDNSSDFIHAINQSLALSCLKPPKVVCHTISLNKIEIMKKAFQFNVPVEKIWSCYENASKPCGSCESCQRFQRALENIKGK